MKKILSKSGLTLIELMVALMLVSIVLLGITSINMALNNNNQDFGQQYLVKSETQLTLNHILNNISLAVGSSRPNDEGILSPIGGDSNTFCIHQANASGAYSGQNIVDSTTNVNGIWLCYTFIPGTSPTNPYQIYWCTETYTVGADPRGATSNCTTASTNYTFLGTAFSITIPTPPMNTTNGINVTIQNCLNDSAINSGGALTCNGTSSGVSSDSVNNPEVTVTGNVFPPQYSTG